MAVDRQAVWDALDVPTIAYGPKVEAFEEQIAALTGCPHALALQSGSAALHLV